MARGFYLTEVDDPDLDRLVGGFLQQNPWYEVVEVATQPIVLLPTAKVINKEPLKQVSLRFVSPKDLENEK